MQAAVRRAEAAKRTAASYEVWSAASVAGPARGDAAGQDLGDAARGSRGGFGRRRLLFAGGARLDPAEADREDFDPFRERVFGRCGVVPGEVEVVAAAVAGVAVVADP